MKRGVDLELRALNEARPTAITEATARSIFRGEDCESFDNWPPLLLVRSTAEMPEERELLEHGTGELRRFLEELGAWDPGFEPIGPSPVDYVLKGELRDADWLIAHGTYLEPSEFRQLRSETVPGSRRVAVAYCPRTHARFGHAKHPYQAMHAQGVVVCLGTDSLASSPTLGILDEARFLARRDEGVSPHLLLSMATLFGAWALRAECDTGSLVVGKSADLAIVALPDREDEPGQLVLQSDLSVVATMFKGRFVHGLHVDL